MGIEFGNLMKDVECVRCEGNVPYMFDFVVGKEGCMCHDCCAEIRQVEESMEREDAGASRAAMESFDRARKLCGIPKMVAEIIGLQWNNQDPPIIKKGDNLFAAKVVSKYANAHRLGILCLSGHNGLGKTVSACWAAWKTRGKFLTRSEWSMMPPWNVESQDYTIKGLISCPGIVVLDEVCLLAKGGDSANPVRVLSMIACERHDSGLGTILTTRAKKQQFYEIYENDMLDRMLHHEESGGSGWVECKGRSLRASKE